MTYCLWAGGTRDFRIELSLTSSVTLASPASPLGGDPHLPKMKNKYFTLYFTGIVVGIERNNARMFLKP